MKKLVLLLGASLLLMAGCGAKNIRWRKFK